MRAKNIGLGLYSRIKEAPNAEVLRRGGRDARSAPMADAGRIHGICWVRAHSTGYYRKGEKKGQRKIRRAKSERTKEIRVPNATPKAKPRPTLRAGAEAPHRFGRVSRPSERSPRGDTRGSGAEVAGLLSLPLPLSNRVGLR